MKSTVELLDCMIGLQGMPDKSAYLAYCDTQYGILEDGRKSASRGNKVLQKDGSRTFVPSKHISSGWDNETMGGEYWDMIFKKSEHQAIFGINYIQHNIPKVKLDWTVKPPRRQQYVEFIERNPVGYIIWDKVNAGNDFSDCELIWTSKNNPTFVKYFMWNGMMQAKDFVNGTTQQANKKLNQKRIHPTEKPILFNDWLLLHMGCRPGNLILDSHSGSQALRISSDKALLDYEGYETHEPYFIAGNKRYFDFKRQIKIDF